MSPFYLTVTTINDERATVAGNYFIPLYIPIILPTHAASFGVFAAVKPYAAHTALSFAVCVLRSSGSIVSGSYKSAKLATLNREYGTLKSETQKVERLKRSVETIIAPVEAERERVKTHRPWA